MFVQFIFILILVACSSNPYYVNLKNRTALAKIYPMITLNTNHTRKPELYYCTSEIPDKNAKQNQINAKILYGVFSVTILYNILIYIF